MVDLLLTNLFNSLFMWISTRFSQNTSITISFLLCNLSDIPSEISNRARENSLTLSLFLCLLSYNSLFSWALLRFPPKVDKCNVNTLSTESFSSSGAYLTSSRAGPSRCPIRKGNFSTAGTERNRSRASSIQSCSSQARPENARRVRVGVAATVTLMDCWLRFRVSTISSRRASLSSSTIRSSRAVAILHRLPWELPSSNPTSDTTIDGLLVFNTFIEKEYAPRGRHAPETLITRSRTIWRSRRQFLASPLIRPLVIYWVSGYKCWPVARCSCWPVAGPGQTAPQQLSSSTSWAWPYTIVPSGDYQYPPGLHIYRGILLRFNLSCYIHALNVFWRQGWGVRLLKQIWRTRFALSRSVRLTIIC